MKKGSKGGCKQNAEKLVDSAVSYERFVYRMLP